MNSTEKNYFASDKWFRSYAKVVALFGVQNKTNDGNRSKIFGGSVYDGLLGNASHNDFFDIYKLSLDGSTVANAYRTKMQLSVYMVSESGGIVNRTRSSTKVSGFPKALVSDINFGTVGLYTNLSVPGRLWAQGVNTAGEFAMYQSSLAAWASGYKGQTIINMKSTDFVDADTIVAPCVFPFGGTSIKVNASRPDVAAITFNSRGSSVLAGQDYSLSAVTAGLTAIGLPNQWGIDGSGRDVEWTENISITHYQCPNDFYITQQANASQLVFNSFKLINDKNGKICNGVVLCDITNDGLLKIRITPSNKGKIYLWQASTSEDTWGGKKSGSTINESLFPYNVNVTQAGVEWERSFDVHAADGPLWLVYAPNAGTTDGSLQGKLDNIVVSLTTEG